MSVTVLGAAGSPTGQALPLVLDLSAGYPSPAQDYEDGPIQLEKELIKNPASTFIGRVSGSSMLRAHICDGDIVIVDRAITPRHGSIVVAVVDGMLTVKRLLLTAGTVILHAENPAFRPLRIREEDLVIWGVVQRSIHETIAEDPLVPLCLD